MFTCGTCKIMTSVSPAVCFLLLENVWKCYFGRRFGTVGVPYPDSDCTCALRSESKSSSSSAVYITTTGLHHHLLGVEHVCWWSWKNVYCHSCIQATPWQMMVDYFIFGKTFALVKTFALWSAMFMPVTSKQYVTNWATLGLFQMSRST